MRIVTTAKPRYPERLREAGIEGTVVVRFTVDTTGRVDRRTAQVVSSTHDLFSRAVLEALDGFRFKPAEVGTRRVAALAEMPFEFRITK
ncbi:MAG TPA: energy transducer TonB [Xanthobacteraceae bacterium]|jgi:protein TonB|nr:energy transducer TonB [Xanthobacteraceae bacterium]